MNENRTLLVVRTPEDAARLADQLFDGLEDRIIALDVEEDRMMHYQPSIALLQVSWDQHDAVIDPLRLPEEVIAPLVEAICLRPKTVLMHGAQNDIPGLKRDFGVGPERLIDTQLTARFGGYRAFGLASLLHEEFGIRLEKETRMSDWTARPLTEKQIAYARRDTAYLVDLWEKLRIAAQRSGFEDAVQEESRVLASQDHSPWTFDPGGWRSMKGARDLSGLAETRLAALWSWRESTARALDMHTTRIMPPWLMIQLAVRGTKLLSAASRKRALRTLLDLPQSDELAALLQDPPAIDESTDASPCRNGSGRTGPRPPWSRHDDFEERYSRLHGWRKRTAMDTGLESGLLAPRTLLECIADVDRPDAPEIQQIDDVRAWRTRRWTDEWLDLL